MFDYKYNIYGQQKPFLYHNLYLNSLKYRCLRILPWPNLWPLIYSILKITDDLERIESPGYGIECSWNNFVQKLISQEINFIMNLFKYVKEFFGFVESSWTIYSELSLTTI